MEELSKKEIKEIKKKISESFGIDFDVKPPLFLKEYNEDLEVIFGKNAPVAIKHDENYAPTLNYLWSNKIRPTKGFVLVDKGAIKFIMNGADVMRPGILEISEGLGQGDMVIVLESVNKTPIAIGELLFPRDEILAMDKGKVIKNLHHLEDKIWKNKI